MKTSMPIVKIKYLKLAIAAYVAQKGAK